MKKFAILGLLLASFGVSAQQRLGLTTSRYSGLNSSFINPSFSIISPYQFDLNLATACFSADNYLLNMKGSLADLFWEEATVQLVNKKNTGFNVDMLGKLPSLSLKFDRFSAGFFYNKRLNISGYRFPSQFVNDMVYGFDKAKNGQVMTMPLCNMGLMFWDEMGVNFSGVLAQFENDRINMGMNVKYAFGAEAYHFRTDGDWKYVYNDTTLRIRDLTGEVRYMGEQYGKGVAFDVGFNWVKLQKGKSFAKTSTPNKKLNKDYLFHLGVSLTDAGNVRFGDGYVHKVNVRNLDIPVLASLKSIELDSLEELLFGVLEKVDTAGSVKIGSGGTVSLGETSQFDIKMPTAFGLQFDYHVKNKFYVNSSLTLGLSSQFLAQLRRPSQLTVTPRIQSPNFDFSLPLSFYEFRTFTVGAAIRIKGFEIGSDRLYSYTDGMSKYKGADVYVSMKISIEELEHTFLKPYIPKKEKPVEVGGYANKFGFKPGEKARIYYSDDPREGQQLYLNNFKGDTLEYIHAEISGQRKQRYRAWKYGYGYAISANYKVSSKIPSGVYFVENKIPVVIKPATADKPEVLVVVPTNTLEANNTVGGRGLHNVAAESKRNKPGNIVSFLRPYSGRGFRDLEQLSAMLAKYPAGKVGYITDIELERYSSIKDAKVIIIAGNSQHWTRQARENFDKYIEKGGNAMLFSFDFMKYQVRYRSKDRQLVCYKRRLTDPTPDALNKTTRWDDPNLEYTRPAYRTISFDYRTVNFQDSAVYAGPQSLLKLESDVMVDVFKLRYMPFTRDLQGKPEMLQAILYPKANYMIPVYVVKNTAKSGLLVDFGNDEVIRAGTDTEKALFTRTLNAILAK